MDNGSGNWIQQKVEDIGIWISNLNLNQQQTYEEFRELSRSLEKLSQLKKVDWDKTQMKKNNLSTNLGLINQQLKKIIDKDNAFMTKQLEKYEAQKRRIQELEKINRRLEDKVIALEGEMDRKEKDVDRFQEQVRKLEKQAVELRNGLMNFAESMIDYRENLSLMKADQSDEVTNVVNIMYDDVGIRLEELGVDIIDDTDKPFDPAVHEALSTQGTNDRDKVNTIAKCFQPGYRYKDQCLKGQRVQVYV